VRDVRIARGNEFQMTGNAERKEREPTLVLDGVGTRKCSSRSELIDDNECAKRDSEESLYSFICRLMVASVFCCEQVAN